MKKCGQFWLVGTMAAGFLLASTALSAPAQAARVERVFRGQIVITKKRPPSKFRSQGAFIGFLRKHRLKSVWPAKKTAGPTKSWRFQYMAFFKRSLNDREVKMRFYDITEGRRFVAADSVYTSQRKQRILSSSMELEAPRFRINRKYVMYLLDARNYVLAKTTFYLRGRGERFSGKVKFTDDETRGK